MKGIKILMALAIVGSIAFLAYSLGKSAGKEIVKQAHIQDKERAESISSNLVNEPAKHVAPLNTQQASIENEQEEVQENLQDLSIEGIDDSLAVAKVNQDYSPPVVNEKSIANDTSYDEGLRKAGEKMFNNFNVSVEDLQNTYHDDPHDQEPVDEEWAVQAEQLIRDAAKHAQDRVYNLQAVDCRTKACKISLQSEQEDAFLNGVTFSEVIREQVWFDSNTMDISFEPVSRNGVMLVRFTRVI